VSASTAAAAASALALSSASASASAASGNGDGSVTGANTTGGGAAVDTIAQRASGGSGGGGGGGGHADGTAPSGSGTDKVARTLGVDDGDTNGCTALHMAAAHGHVQVIEALVAKGAVRGLLCLLACWSCTCPRGHLAHSSTVVANMHIRKPFVNLCACMCCV
jgi:hypothetical protein